MRQRILGSIFTLSLMFGALNPAYGNDAEKWFGVLLSGGITSIIIGAPMWGVSTQYHGRKEYKCLGDSFSLCCEIDWTNKTFTPVNCLAQPNSIPDCTEDERAFCAKDGNGTLVLAQDYDKKWVKPLFGTGVALTSAGILSILAGFLVWVVYE